VVKKKAARGELESKPSNLGFQLLIKAIVDAKRPIIGHNLSLDLFFIFEHFIEELPSDYNTFASRLLALFPIIYDTKMLCFEVQKVKKKLQTSLPTLFKDIIMSNGLLYPFNNCILEKGLLTVIVLSSQVSANTNRLISCTKPASMPTLLGSCSSR